MINATFATTPTTPGQPVKGASPVGGGLFALSMLAVGAGDTAVDPNGADIAADAPARQALAAPGIALPTPVGASVLDPALAWLPAVDIPVPAPLDVPPVLARVASDPAAAVFVARPALRAQPVLRSGTAVAALTAPALAPVALPVVRPEQGTIDPSRAQGRVPVARGSGSTAAADTQADAAVLPADEIETDSVPRRERDPLAALRERPSTSASPADDRQPAVSAAEGRLTANLPAHDVVPELPGDTARPDGAAAGTAAPTAPRVRGDMATGSTIETPPALAITVKTQAVTGSPTDHDAPELPNDTTVSDRPRAGIAAPAARQARQDAGAAPMVGVPAAAVAAAVGPRLVPDTSTDVGAPGLPSDAAAPDRSVSTDVQPTAKPTQRDAAASPMVDPHAGRGGASDLQPAADDVRRGAAGPSTSPTIENLPVRHDTQVASAVVIQADDVVAGEPLPPGTAAPTRRMDESRPGERVARDPQAAVVLRQSDAETSRQLPSSGPGRSAAGDAVLPPQRVTPLSQPATNPSPASITPGEDVAPASLPERATTIASGPVAPMVTPMVVAPDDGPTKAVAARKAVAGASAQPRSGNRPVVEALRAKSATAQTDEDVTHSPEPSPRASPDTVAAILPSAPPPIAVPVEHVVASSPHIVSSASDGGFVAPRDQTAALDRRPTERVAVPTPAGSAPAIVRDDAAAITQGFAGDARHDATVADRPPATPPTAVAQTAARPLQTPGVAQPRPPSPPAGSTEIAATQQTGPRVAQGAAPGGATVIAPKAALSRASKQDAGVLQSVDRGSVSPRQADSIAPAMPRIATPASVQRPADAAPTPRTASIVPSATAEITRARAPSAPGAVPQAADAAAIGTPIVAVAAPVGVAGETVSPEPMASGLPVTPAEPRPTFMREVSGHVRQTVALAPQSRAVSQPTAGVTAPAAQVFGAAMHAAGVTDERKRVDPSDPSIVAAVAPSPVREVAATADAGQPTLDMRQDGWPTHMVDHIEALRDAANATDTRIRLVPDALGAIDIAVKTVGDAIHVRFAAEDATTRTMIEEAQPRLAEIAQERGLKIGQTIVEPAAAQSQSNAGQSNAGQSNAGQSNQPSTGQQPAGQQQASAQAQAGQQQPRQQSQQQQAASPRQPAAGARAPSHDKDAAGNGRIA